MMDMDKRIIYTADQIPGIEISYLEGGGSCSIKIDMSFDADEVRQIATLLQEIAGQLNQHPAPDEDA